MRKIITLMLLSFSLSVITGCTVGKNAQSHELDWQQGHGELPATIGTTDNTFFPPESMMYSSDNYIEKTEYAAPSGKWFFHNGDGSLGYGMTTGTQRAGDMYNVHLISHETDGEELDRHIRIQLTKRDQQLQLEEIIHEETIYVDIIHGETEIYTNELPTEENAIYLLGMEILDELGEVEDTMARVIYVPKQEINATLETDKQTYQSSEIATLTLTNFGPTLLMLDTYYTIEKEVDGIWRVVPLDLAFEDIAIILTPPEQYEQKVDLKELTPGKYRIIKNIHADGTDLTASLAAEFLIK